MLASFYILQFQVDPAYAVESAKTSFYGSLDKTAQGTGHIETSQQTGKTAPEIVGKIIKAFLSLLGIIFILLMIYGGYIWFIARGNDSEVKKAQDIIRNAIVGAIIVVAAYGITNLISGTLFKAIAQ
jgi:hypothetical protein